MDEHVYPAEASPTSSAQRLASPWDTPAVVEELKAEARRQGLWNLFLPDAEYGAGLTNLQYAPLAEITGRSPQLAPTALNCAAPDTGNMEVLAQFGDEQQQKQWLEPLLAGEIRSAFAMTEPEVASSDATNIETRIERDGDEYVINGRKWYISGAMNPDCKIFIVMGKTDPDGVGHPPPAVDDPGAARHPGRRGQARDAGVRLRGPLPRRPRRGGLRRRRGCRPSNLIGEEGGGFAIAQARLGPGRIHHCMRLIGMAERAIELMCRRAVSRTAFGKPLAQQGVVQNWIADARVAVEQLRLLVLKTAWLMDTVGNKGAHTEIQAIKIATPRAVVDILDQAVQLHGAGGVSQDFPLAELWAGRPDAAAGGRPGRGAPAVAGAAGAEAVRLTPGTAGVADDFFAPAARCRPVPGGSARGPPAAWTASSSAARLIEQPVRRLGDGLGLRPQGPQQQVGQVVGDLLRGERAVGAVPGGQVVDRAEVVVHHQVGRGRRGEHPGLAGPPRSGRGTARGSAAVRPVPACSSRG